MDDSGFKIRLSAIEKLSKEKVQGHVVKERDRIMREVMRLQIEHYKIKEKENDNDDSDNVQKQFEQTLRLEPRDFTPAELYALEDELKCSMHKYFRDGNQKLNSMFKRQFWA